MGVMRIRSTPVKLAHSRGSKKINGNNLFMGRLMSDYPELGFLLLPSRSIINTLQTPGVIVLCASERRCIRPLMMLLLFLTVAY